MALCLQVARLPSVPPLSNASLAFIYMLNVFTYRLVTNYLGAGPRQATTTAWTSILQLSRTVLGRQSVKHGPTLGVMIVMKALV